MAFAFRLRSAFDNSYWRGRIVPPLGDAISAANATNAAVIVNDLEQTWPLP
ncbi:MAG TPA: hypothetical protein VKT20_01130 [Candidatus Dormibacteraeota bacterium]|nr:hypothetical protein [Candidatus Dormibacteraeota bacterium]